jgi:hypothetical protein
MKISTRPLQLFFAIATGMSLVSLITPQPIYAQTAANVNPLEDLNPDRSRDPFSRANQGEGVSGIMDLMHRAQQGNIRDLNEFSAEQNQNINDAAAKFRQQQLQMMRGGNNNQGNNQVKPAATPQVAP